MLGREFKFAVCAFTCVFIYHFFSGCKDKNTVSSERVAIRKGIGELKKGITKEQVEEILGTNAQHEFTAILEGDRFHCISYSFVKYYINYFFTFKNEKLFSIIEYPPFEYDLVPYIGTSKQQVRKPWTPEERIKKVLESENLLGEAFVQSLEKSVSKYKKTPVSYNQLPALVMIAPLILMDTPNRRKEAELNAQLIEKYDPDKIDIGMTDQEVNDALGEPHHSRALSPGKVLHVYGEEASLRKLAQENWFSWIAVVFEDGRVTRIFSHSFFHKELFGNNTSTDKTSTPN